MFVTTYITNYSNETREIFNYGINVVIENINNLIKEYDLKFNNFTKINYKKKIEKGNNYYFLNFLEKRIVDVLYNFCLERDILEYIYSNKNFDKIMEFLEMNFGEFLLKKGFPFSNEYKNKHSTIKIENNLFPYTPICLDKLVFKQESKEKIKIENIDNNISEIVTSNSTNFDNNNLNEYSTNEKNEKKSFDDHIEPYKNLIKNNDNLIFENNNENEKDEISSSYSMPNQEDEIYLFKKTYFYNY